MRRRSMVLAATAAAAFSLAFLGCEILLRLVRPGENLRATATLGVLTPDPELGWVLAPNLDFQKRWLGRLVTIRTDEKGRRVPATGPSRAAGGQIAFAGDSYVFGNEVDAEETFVHLVGETVERKTTNLGVGAYRLSQSASVLARHLGGDAEVALGVLVVYIGNDLEYGAHPSPALRVDSSGHLVGAPPGLSADLRAFALRRSRVLFSLHTAWRRLGSEPDTRRAPRQHPSRWIYDQHRLGPDRLAEHRAVLASLRDRARLLGVPVVVVLMPERGQVYGALGDLPNRTLAAMLSELGLDHFDLLPQMRRAAVERPPLWHDVVEGHLSIAGHRWVADALIGWIEELEGRRPDPTAR